MVCTRVTMRRFHLDNKENEIAAVRTHRARIGAAGQGWKIIKRSIEGGRGEGAGGMSYARPALKYVIRRRTPQWRRPCLFNSV